MQKPSLSFINSFLPFASLLLFFMFPLSAQQSDTANSVATPQTQQLAQEEQTSNTQQNTQNTPAQPTEESTPSKTDNSPTSFTLITPDKPAGIVTLQLIPVVTNFLRQTLSDKNISLSKTATQDDAVITPTFSENNGKTVITLTIEFHGQQLIAPQTASFTSTGELKAGLQQLAAQTARAIHALQPKETPQQTAPVVAGATTTATAATTAPTEATGATTAAPTAPTEATGATTAAPTAPTEATGATTAAPTAPTDIKGAEATAATPSSPPSSTPSQPLISSTTQKNGQPVTSPPPTEAAQTKQEVEQKQAKKGNKEKTDRTTKQTKRFVKGRLANIGSNYIISPFNRAVLGTGMTRIKDDYYLTLDPRLSLNLHRINLIMGFHLPFNIQMFSTDFTKKNDGQFKLRKADWDEWQDYLKVIQYIEFGNTESNIYFSIGNNFAHTLGHGTIMRRYIPNQDPTRSTLSTRLNYYNDYFGFETIFGDIGQGNMFGGLVFVKPLSLFLHDYHSKSLSFGFSFMADRNAPKKLDYVSYPNMPDPDSSEWDTMNGILESLGKKQRPRRVDSDSYGRPIVDNDHFFYLMGLDTEFKFYKNEFVDIKSFVDYSWFQTNMSRGGLTVGTLGRFNLDKRHRHAMRVQLEYRYSMNGYLPSFFDTYYSIERYELVSNLFGKDNFMPDGRSKYWHSLAENRDFSSFYWEWSYAFSQWLALSVGMEFYPDSYSWFAYLELPDLWIVSAMLTYMQRGIRYGHGLGESFDFNALLKGVVRVQILPILFIDAYASRTDMFWPEELPRKDDNYRGHFVAAWQWGFDIEIGWEWGNRTAESHKK